ncbi:p62 [Dendrolimus punctatus cypovirus 22]|uniref:p62 n=1 Tax=Dendrolimus punctatus cypovirus 22 TaxID=1577776 RepID=UPI00053F69C5|nr:p62 [Dendrolimus punctatus cypovirus 22]AIY60604.1 p62 [Dendrolimus punctatus cypovirus 22]
MEYPQSGFFAAETPNDNRTITLLQVRGQQPRNIPITDILDHIEGPNTDELFEIQDVTEYEPDHTTHATNTQVFNINVLLRSVFLSEMTNVSQIPHRFGIFNVMSAEDATCVVQKDGTYYASGKTRDADSIPHVYIRNFALCMLKVAPYLRGDRINVFAQLTHFMQTVRRNRSKFWLRFNLSDLNPLHLSNQLSKFNLFLLLLDLANYEHFQVNQSAMLLGSINACLVCLFAAGISDAVERTTIDEVKYLQFKIPSPSENYVRKDLLQPFFHSQRAIFVGFLINAFIQPYMIVAFPLEVRNQLFPSNRVPVVREDEPVSDHDSGEASNFYDLYVSLNYGAFPSDGGIYKYLSNSDDVIYLDVFDTMPFQQRYQKRNIRGLFDDTLNTNLNVIRVVHHEDYDSVLLLDILQPFNESLSRCLLTRYIIDRRMIAVIASSTPCGLSDGQLIFNAHQLEVFELITERYMNDVIRHIPDGYGLAEDRARVLHEILALQASYINEIKMTYKDFSEAYKHKTRSNVSLEKRWNEAGIREFVTCGLML